MEQVISRNNIYEKTNPDSFTRISFPMTRIVREELVSISEPLLDRSIVDASLNSISKVSSIQENGFCFFSRYPVNSC